MKSNCYIKENSWLAKIAAAKLGEKRVAMVIGKTIYLHNTTRNELIQDKEWLCHELMHIKQFQQNGFAGFLFKYLLESIKNGYFNNKFEIEARENEQNEQLLKEYNIV